MKLQNKINYRFLLLLFLIFTLAGITLYVILGIVVDDYVDETIQTKASKVMQFLKANPDSDLNTLSHDQSISCDLISPCREYISFSDTTVFDPAENDLVQGRKLTRIANIYGRYYKLQIIQSGLETENLIKTISLFMAGLFILITIVLFLLNNLLSTSLWIPFYNTLRQLRQFKPGINDDLRFDRSDVLEFNELNHVLNKMVLKINHDFKNIREFSENASHEIQTPASVIRSKLETLLQDKSFPEEYRSQVQVAYNSTLRLSRLTEALLLLSKIENQQFPNQSVVNLNELIKERTDSIEELLVLKRITLSRNIETPFRVKINAYLAEVLINNLLNNAIRHNSENGQIIISSYSDRIIFSNSGEPLKIDAEKIFQRFVKHTSLNESSGLGLSIASEICRASNLELRYSYQNQHHNFYISLKS